MKNQAHTGWNPKVLVSMDSVETRDTAQAALKAAFLFLLEAIVMRLRAVKHPAAKLAALLLQGLLALRAGMDVRVWLSRELPKLARALDPYKARHSLIEVFQSLINAIQSLINVIPIVTHIEVDAATV